MAYLTEHGGGCCGVRHIHGMDNTSVPEFQRLIDSVDAMEQTGLDISCRLIEVILSERQVTGNRNDPSVTAEGGWPVVMRRLGFRLVSAFHNGNSGRNCYVFHRATQRTTLPFEWPEFHGQLATRRPAQIEAPVRVANRFFQNVFADGRRGGMYDTYELAEAAAPRCRRRDRLTVMSNGLIEREENV